MKKKLIGYILFFIALVLCFWYFLFKDTDVLNQSTLINRGVLKPFSFVNQDSAFFNNTDMRGKVCVVNFFFTTCKGICPRMNNNMKSVYNDFKNNPDVLFISHTCNPETDSVPILKRYADSLQINQRKWIFLTGSKESLYKMARLSYGIDDPNNVVNNSKDDFLHSQFFALVDKNGNVRGAVYDGLKKDELEKLEQDIKSLLKENNGNFANSIFN